MRIAMGGFMHETNTFVAAPTTWDDFARAGPWPGATEGPALLSIFRGLNLGIAHAVEKAERAGHDIVPLAWAGAVPGGRVTDDAFERMSAMLLDRLAGAEPDAVYLELHGAMVTESHDDGEGALLERVRAAVGDVPILVSLDLHANVSPRMVELADFISSYRTYPHVDWGPTGGRAIDWLDRVMAYGRSVRTFRSPRALRQAPFLIPVTTGCTLLDPAKRLYDMLPDLEGEGVHLSLNMGFPPADIPDVGPSVTAYGGSQAEVEAAADRLMEALIRSEPEFAAHRPLPVDEAVREAKRMSRTASRPVVLADTQDNPGAGAPSNTTGLIAELLRQGVNRAVVGLFHDPEAAAEAHRAGLGGTVARLGHTPGAESPGSVPLPGPWRVAALSDGRFRGTSPMLRAALTDMGPTALLAQDGVEVVVNTIRQQPIHRESFTHLGVDFGSYAVIGVKSSAHFRAGFQEIAERVIVALAPGVNLEDPTKFPYTKIRPGLRLSPRAAPHP